MLITSGESQMPMVSVEIDLSRGFGGLPRIMWLISGGPNEGQIDWDLPRPVLLLPQ